MSNQKESKEKLFLVGVSVGLFYGLLIRAGSIAFPTSEIFGEMSLGFLFLLPFAMGFCTVFWIERRKALTIAMRAFLPWFPILGGTLATMIVFWEGMICAVLFLTISLTLSTLGGLAGGLAANRKPSRTGGNLTLGSVLLLPLLVTPW